MEKDVQTKPKQRKKKPKLQNETIDKVIIYNILIIQNMKQLIKTLEHDEYSNQFYYNKMLSDFEMESRYNSLRRSLKNKFRSESLKYLERVHHMKEKTEENYINRINTLQKSLDEKQLKIKNRKLLNQKLKEEIKRQSHELSSEKEKKAKDTYNRKLKMDEFERTNNERKLIDKSKKNIFINFYSENNNTQK